VTRSQRTAQFAAATREVCLGFCGVRQLVFGKVEHKARRCVVDEPASCQLHRGASAACQLEAEHAEPVPLAHEATEAGAVFDSEVLLLRSHVVENTTGFSAFAEHLHETNVHPANGFVGDGIGAEAENAKAFCRSRQEVEHVERTHDHVRREFNRNLCTLLLVPVNRAAELRRCLGATNAQVRERRVEHVGCALGHHGAGAALGVVVFAGFVGNVGNADASRRLLHELTHAEHGVRVRRGCFGDADVRLNGRFLILLRRKGKAGQGHEESNDDCTHEISSLFDDELIARDARIALRGPGLVGLTGRDGGIDTDTRLVRRRHRGEGRTVHAGDRGILRLAGVHRSAHGVARHVVVAVVVHRGAAPEQLLAEHVLLEGEVSDLAFRRELRRGTPRASTVRRRSDSDGSHAHESAEGDCPNVHQFHEFLQ